MKANEMNEAAEFAMELGLVSRRWRARLDERLKHTGLTQSRWFTLLQLMRAGPVSQRELAELVGVEGPTLVRILDNLETQGLLARQGCGDDRRVKRIYLTEAAKPALEEITRISAELRSQLFADVSPGDLAAARKVMQAIAGKLEKH